MTERAEWVFDLCERIYGRRPSSATVARWKTVGKAGRKLRTVTICGRIMCRESDLRSFAEGPEFDEAPARVSDQVADRLHADAMRELDAVLGD
jgi:hypothetical protein